MSEQRFIIYSRDFHTLLLILFLLLEVITDQCSAFDLIKEIEVLAAGMELDFFLLDNLLDSNPLC